MSKYADLWLYVKNCGKDEIKISFDDIKIISNFEVDHSFLTYKKELNDYGYHVKKISMKNKNIIFERNKNNEVN